ncbi:unnamed protein product [Durusdinium trenchii]|uniref:Uncharacterized protein n=1 Tax=Durusdinium trenchii TaxID=1381693 RepID=A0ABP0L3V5_9DINO
MPNSGRSRTRRSSSRRAGDGHGGRGVQLKGRGATLKPRPEAGAPSQGSVSSSSDSEADMAKPPGVWDGVKTKQPPPRLKVSGCTHSAVRAIICGDYLPEAKSNHEKPVYRKVDGKQVLLYFWDARHGTEQMGWWFGPEIGGEKVWAHNASPGGPEPPSKGCHPRPMPWRARSSLGRRCVIRSKEVLDFGRRDSLGNSRFEAGRASQALEVKELSINHGTSFILFRKVVPLHWSSLSDYSVSVEHLRAVFLSNRASQAGCWSRAKNERRKIKMA